MEKKVSIFSDLNNLIDQAALEAYEPENPRLVTLLYQTGYLTIKSFRQIGEKRKYSLCFPNYEVTDSFLSSLAPIYAGLGPTEATNYQFAAQEALWADVAGGGERRRNPLVRVSHACRENTEADVRSSADAS